MIAVDTSALIAIVLDEPGHEAYSELLLATPAVMSAASWVETARVVVAKLGTAWLARVRLLVATYAIEIVPVDAAQAELAIAAMLAFGKGRHRPPAVLNYGDLFSYALARSRDLPLLFKGEAFARTDLRRAEA